MVQLDEDVAINKVDLPTGSKQSVQSIEKATDTVVKKQSSVKSKIEKIAGSKAKHSFGYLLNAFSINVKVGDIEKIEALSGVVSVTPTQVFYPTDTHANAIADVQKVWEDKKLHGEGMVISIIYRGIDPDHKDLFLSNPESGSLTKESIKKWIKENTSVKRFRLVIIMQTEVMILLMWVMLACMVNMSQELQDQTVK